MMVRGAVLILAVLGLAACTAGSESARYQFGVSASRPASQAASENDPATRATLDWEARQICTRGYQVIKVDTLAAEANTQIVDLDLQCDPYRVDFTPSSPLRMY
jgi:hypothetical protein